MHLKSLTPTSLPFPIAYILKILLMPSLLTKSCGKLKDIIAALRETRQSLLSIENPTTEDPDSTDSSSVASKTHDDPGDAVVLMQHLFEFKSKTSCSTDLNSSISIVGVLL